MTSLPQCQNLELELDNDWLTIWFNRPEVRNALSQNVITEMRGVFSAIRDDRCVRGITIRGRGGFFCAGGDLKAFRSISHGRRTAEEIAAFSNEAGELFAQINEAPQVVMMLVEGAAIAGGFGIVCGGDVVVVTKDCRFALTETKIGIVPAQIAPYVAQRIGLTKARRLMLTAAQLDGTEAGEIGIADYVVESPHDFAEIEQTIRKQVRGCAPNANAITKEVLLATRATRGDEMIKLAGKSFARCMLSDEGREGITSFLEKREPQWALSPENKEA